MMTETRNSKNQPLPESERITDPTRIERLLDRLAKQHALLTVMIPGHTERFTSSIVNVAGPHVLLDELMPTGGHRLLLEARALEVTGKLDGIEFRFSATLEDIDSHDDMIAYRVNLPALLEYCQRRMDYRAHIPIAQTRRVIIARADDSVIEGELFDLSRGGAGIVLPGEAPALKPARWYECAIELPGADWLYCAIEMRHAKDMPSGDRHLIGVQFDKLSSVQARLVAHCIVQLERELIRKRVAD
ncbi:MAG: flagellar regulator YcgR PilZN domain-containing protein [Gammaproteobacteria bacterium]